MVKRTLCTKYCNNVDFLGVCLLFKIANIHYYNAKRGRYLCAIYKLYIHSAKMQRFLYGVELIRYGVTSIHLFDLKMQKKFLLCVLWRVFIFSDTNGRMSPNLCL